MAKTVWLNLDENKVDVTCLDQKFAEAGIHFIKRPIDRSDEETTIEMGLKADAVISTWEPWNERTLNAVKDKVQFIVRYGAGTDNIDIPAATRAGIPVANTPGANAAAVAETAMLHILNAGRRFTQCVGGVKNHVWPSTITGNELDGKTVGLIGFGNIARKLVRMLSGFEVKILAYDVFVSDEAKKMNVEFAPSMEYVFEHSDIISLHIPHVKETDKVIDKHLFDLMKPTAYLINTCRGGVVNEPDLIDALRNKKLQGAGLDVLTVEPPEKDNPLVDMENVFITSHMGAASLESEHRSQVIIADSIIEFFGGKLPFNVKNPEVVSK